MHFSAADPRRQRGFTLLECVMVFVLMGAVGLIVSLCLTTAPSLIFRGATEEAAFRRVENCMSRLDAAYRSNEDKVYAGLQAVVAAGTDPQVCPDVTVRFERVRLGEQKKLVTDEDDASGKPSMLRVEVVSGEERLVKIYAK